MPPPNTPEAYRKEAERLRRLAGIASSEAIKRELINTADQFDQLAESAELAAKHFGRKSDVSAKALSRAWRGRAAS